MYKVKTKVCIKCKEEKPLSSEYYGRNKRNKDGFNGACKVCKNEYSKRYREKNKEYFQKYRKENREYYLEYNRNYYQNNKEYHRNYVEENKERRKKYFEANRENRKKYHKTYYNQNKPQMQEQKKKYYLKNRERILKHNRKYRKENRHILNRAQQRRRAVKAKLPRTLTSEQWNVMKLHFDNSCSYCGMTEEEHLKKFSEVLHQDHFVPLKNGGEYTHNNIVPACRSCNSSKHDKDFFEWYPTRESYSKQRENKILKFLNYETNKTQQLSIL